MALTKCKECGREVTDQADKCPGCGMVIRKKGGCGRTAVIIFGLIVLAAFVLPAVCLLSRGPSAERPLALGKVTAGCDTTAMQLMERLHRSRPQMEALLGKARRWSARLEKALDEGRTIERWSQSSEDAAAERKLDRLADSCGRLMADKVRGLEPGREVLLGFSWTNVEQTVVFNVFINYETRARGGGSPSLAEVQADLSDAAGQLAPKLFTYYPRLEYVSLHVISRDLTLAKLGLGRKAAGILGDSLPLYREACVAKVQGLSYRDESGEDAFMYEPNQALIKMGKLK
ncbi:zinc ribbon domain-containing protein [candidate division WOR-3 bacterium]|uniref:Zinc ribbon domain-containing protein n=1 Tax=candidate division WOR-3 bacterium TaxID=2052148 RepID=A0A937XC81_UNCW3|nr:zinc ribbon domain-containing protein [candidate division WOR-3 bacterium]